MRVVLAVLCCAAPLAIAQVPATSANPTAQSMCGECGVVRTIRAVKKEERPTAADNTKPSGLVATVPFGKGAGAPSIGSSTQAGGKDSVTILTRWELVVRMDDGRYRVVMQDEEPELREGDKVRIDDGRVVLRGG